MINELRPISWKRAYRECKPDNKTIKQDNKNISYNNVIAAFFIMKERRCRK
jgi:hypothetical protein